MVVSARSEKALKELAGRYGEFLAGQDADGLDLADFCHTTQEGREHHAVRLAVVGESLEELRSGLDAAMTHEEWTTTNTGDEHRPVFLFTGQGAQRSGMGKELYQAQPCFRAELDRCARLFDPLLPEPLLRVMWDADKAALLDNTAFTQPALFSLEYALARMWQSFGIQPLAAAGHSIGEYVAATLAGVFSLEDAARLVAARGRLIASLPAGGGMSAVLASEKDVLALLAACGTPERTGIAAVNGSTQTVLSGPLEDLARIADKAGSCLLYTSDAADE